jgi:hypothetical protein
MVFLFDILQLGFNLINSCLGHTNECQHAAVPPIAPMTGGTIQLVSPKFGDLIYVVNCINRSCLQVAKEFSSYMATFHH